MSILLVTIYVGPYGTLPPTIIGNAITDNASSSSYGGGIYVKDRPALIQGNTISGNHAITNGGGIYLGGDTAAQVLSNQILSNTAANYGGGIYARECPALIQGNTISGNTRV